MFAKVLILALAAVANCQILTNYNTGAYGAGLGAYGIPVYKSSALYGGLASANGYGYGANLGRVAGLGALRTTGSIVGSGALGYGTGALIAGAPVVSTVGYGTRSLGLTGLGVGGLGVRGLGVGGYGVRGYGVRGLEVGGLGVGGLGVANLGVANLGVANLGATGLGYGLGVAKGVSVAQTGPVNAAVITQSRTVDYTAVPYAGQPPVVQEIDVPPQESPVKINFQSRSSPLIVTQQHIPAEQGEVQVTNSEDEPQTAIHNVNRPVIQQVNEVIQPIRTLRQEIRPVEEEIHTTIAQGEGYQTSGLTSGVVGGTGVLAASGLGVAGPVVSGGLGVAAPIVSGGLGVNTLGLGLNRGLGLGYGVSGLGLRTAGLGTNVVGLGGYRTGLAGIGGLRTVGLGNAGLYGTGYYGARTYGLGLGSGLGVNSGLGSGYGSYYTSGYGLGSGLALDGLSGLSGYGQTAKIIRY